MLFHTNQSTSEHPNTQTCTFQNSKHHGLQLHLLRTAPCWWLAHWYVSSSTSPFIKSALSQSPLCFLPSSTFYQRAQDSILGLRLLPPAILTIYAPASTTAKSPSPCQCLNKSCQSHYNVAQSVLVQQLQAEHPRYGFLPRIYLYIFYFSLTSLLSCPVERHGWITGSLLQEETAMSGVGTSKTPQRYLINCSHWCHIALLFLFIYLFLVYQ